MSIHAYHFVGNTLRDGRPVPPDGEWLEHDGPIAICASGLHASRRPWHALAHASGPVLCLVEVDQVSEEHGYKPVARRQRIVRRMDLTDDMRAFARQCALDVLHLWDAPVVVRRYLETGDESLRDAARDAAWAAAWNAIWNAAEDASRAAGDAAYAATWNPSWVAAWNAAGEAARAVAMMDVAWNAARAAQGERFDALCAARLNAPRLTREDSNGPAALEHRHCPTCRHHALDDWGDHWCALGISTAGRVRGLVTHLQPFGCSLHEGKETGDDE